MKTKTLSICVILLFTLSMTLTSEEAYGRCGGGAGGGGGNVIDPPPGQLLKDPVLLPNLSTIPGVFEANLEAKMASVNINGIQANLLTYNGYYPGPTIRFKKGDLLKIHFKNSLPMAGTNILGYQRGITNIHTHGFHVSPEEPSDAAHLHIMPGETYDYEYDSSLHPAGTLNFYHCHVHGLTAEQYWGGLVGCLVAEDETNLLTSYETHVLVVKDITLTGTNPEPYSSMMDYMHGKEGKIVMVNGQVNPVLNIRPGQVQRWRILNAANARFLRLNLQQHNLRLIGTDGGLLDKPYVLSEILLAPGERVDLLVKGDKSSGTYKLLSLPYDRGCSSTLQTVTLMTVSYKGNPTSNTIPTAISNAARPNLDLSVLPHRRLVLSMRHGRGYINDQDFDVDPYTIMSTVGTYEVWEIAVQGCMDHPFHQHVNHAMVLSVNGGYSGYALYATIPAWKDTVYVPKWGSITILVSVMDYTGMTMFHCHIVEHEDIGMMGMWHLMPDMMP